MFPVAAARADDTEDMAVEKISSLRAELRAESCAVLVVTFWYPYVDCGPAGALFCLVAGEQDFFAFVEGVEVAEGNPFAIDSYFLGAGRYSGDRRLDLFELCKGSFEGHCSAAPEV